MWFWHIESCRFSHSNHSTYTTFLLYITVIWQLEPIPAGDTWKWSQHSWSTALAELIYCIVMYSMSHLQEPILALRRQLAVLSGAEKEAGLCWLQQAKICRVTGHFEAACTAGLEALSREVPGAVIEHAKLLWETDQPYRAIARLQQVLSSAIEIHFCTLMLLWFFPYKATNMYSIYPFL